MNFPSILQKRPFLLLLIPATLAFLIALIPTIKFQWPLSWDIYYHVHLTKLYIEQGFTIWDPLTYAPFGRPIVYPPLFHYSLAVLTTIFKMDTFQISRYLQPIFSFSLVISFTYVAKKLYNLRIGLIAGFFLFFTAVFHRAMLPIPESLALIFFPLAIYFYYTSLEGNGLKYAIISGIIGSLMFLTHTLTALMMLGVVLLFTFCLKLRKDKVEYNSLYVFLVVSLILASFWWLNLIVQHGYVFNNPQAALQGPVGYFTILIKTWGVPAMISAILWLVIMVRNGVAEKSIGKSIKECSRNNFLIITWLLFILIISSAYLISIPILIERIFNFAVFPVIIMAALGLEYLRGMNSKKSIYGKIYGVLVVLLIIGAATHGFLYASSVKPLVNDSQRDIAQWFAENGDKKGVVMSLTEGIDPVIVSFSRQPVSTGGYQPGMVRVLDRDLYYSGNYTKEDIVRDNIKYFVEASPIIHKSYLTLVYQNKDYKVWRVDI